MRGAVLLLSVICLLLLVGFVGLALDTAFVRATTQELQRAADAAALAGCDVIADGNEDNEFEPVRTAAVACALANLADGAGVQIDSNAANAPGGDVVVGTWDPATRTFTPDIEHPDAVQVRARRTAGSAGGPVPLLFGGIFGSGEGELARTAIATRNDGAGAAVVLVLHPTMAKAFDMRGNSVMVATSGVLQVNSSHATEAFYLNGAPEVARARAAAIRVHGGSSYPTGSVAPKPVDGSPVVPDPLADLPYPDVAGMPDLGEITDPGTYSPGYYPGGIDANDGEIVLTPGVYVFGAPTGIQLNGDANVVGSEVLVFLQQGAEFQIAGHDAGMEIGAPTSGVYEGVAIFAHRLSTATFDISGSGVFDLEGTMYLAGGHLEMDGVVDRHLGRVIVSSLQFRGTGTYVITGEGPPNTVPLTTYLVR